MTEERRESSFAGLDLDDLEESAPVQRRSRHQIDRTTTAPSREPAQRAELRRQLNTSIPISQYDRFESLCQSEGLSKAKFIVAMMDLWEDRQPRS